MKASKEGKARVDEEQKKNCEKRKRVEKVLEHFRETFSRSQITSLVREKGWKCEREVSKSEWIWSSLSLPPSPPFLYLNGFQFWAWISVFLWISWQRVSLVYALNLMRVSTDLPLTLLYFLTPFFIRFEAWLDLKMLCQMIENFSNSKFCVNVLSCPPVVHYDILEAITDICSHHLIWYVMPNRWSWKLMMSFKERADIFFYYIKVQLSALYFTLYQWKWAPPSSRSGRDL